MEQNDAEVNQNSKMRSGNSEQQKDVTELRSKISLSNFQMLELTHNDQKFTDRIFQLNDKGISSIESGAYEQALLYLGQAQKLLQYAASCGRALDREIILKILNNEAVVYHKIWDLDRSISYIQAIIFNLRTFLNGKENIDVVLKLQEIGQKIQDSSFQQDFLDDFIETHYEKLKLIIQKKFQLSLFYLQYSTLNSQNQDHVAALSESRQAFAQYQQTFGFCTILMKIKKTLRKQHKSQALSLVLLEQVMRIIQPNVQSFGTINKKIQEIQKVFDQKSHAPSSFNFILQKYSSLQKKQPKYKNFSLTSVMELHPKFFGQKILDQQSKLAYDEYFFQQIQNTEILIELILQFSVVLFTISNQIRQTQHQSRAHQNNEHFQPNQQQSANNKKISQLYYISALHISIQIVQELTQFSRYIFKHYFQIYSNEKIKASNQSMSKMDSLKEKYKKFLPMEIDKDFTDSLDDQPCANNISQYSINIKLSQAASKDNKENKLQRLFKQNNRTSPDITTAAPPRLNIDLSQIQSLQYGGSKTFKQNNQHSYNNLPPEQVIEEEYDAKQTKKFQNLNVKKIKTVPNLSDVSSNRQSQSISRQISPQKSNYSKQTNREEKPISSRLKQKSSKKQEQKPKIKLLNHNNQKSKPQIKKFISPKNINRKSYQKNNQTESKKKPFLPQKKIFSDKKIQDQNDKTSSQNKKKLVFKDKKKKKDEITPQPSKRKTQEYFQTQKQKQKDNQEEKKVNRISKLRKAKSFEQVIYPYEDIKPIMYASKDISNTYNHIFHKPISKEKLKTIAQNTKKTKSSQNLKFTVKTARKPVKVQTKPQPVSKALLETNKDSVLKKKKKSNLSIKQPTINSSIAPTKNAVRMSSLSNLMNSANDRQALKKMKSSKSLHQSNYQYSSGYLLKGLQVNASQQRTKAGSMAMTTSLRKIV